MKKDKCTYCDEPLTKHYWFSPYVIGSNDITTYKCDRWWCTLILRCERWYNRVM